MAEVNTNNGGGGMKNKPRKMSLHVDFTPMVDMNMLLLCFFMFCSTLSKPQIMDIVMPADSKENPTLAPESGALTLILDDNDNLYYYHGLPNYEDYTSLKHVSYSDIRDVLLEKNSASVEKVRALKTQFANKEMSEAQFKEKLEAFKKSSEGITVMIKPRKSSSYKNLIDVLDEMQICNVNKYAIMDMSDVDDFLFENLQTKGSLTAMTK